MTPLFSAKAGPNGMPEMTDREAARYAKYCRRFKEGTLLQVPAPRKPKKPRSIEENKYYWGCPIQILSEFFGYEPEEMHEVLKYQFLQDRSGRFPRVKSTTELSTVEFEDYMSRIRRWASIEFSVYIPKPNEVEC